MNTEAPKDSKSVTLLISEGRQRLPTGAGDEERTKWEATARLGRQGLVAETVLGDSGWSER